MNERYQEMVPFDQLIDTVRPVLETFVRERVGNEDFGSYWLRAGLEQYRGINSFEKE